MVRLRTTCFKLQKRSILSTGYLPAFRMILTRNSAFLNNINGFVFLMETNVMRDLKVKAVFVECQIFWDMMMCWLANGYQNFGRACCLHLQRQCSPNEKKLQRCWLRRHQAQANIRNYLTNDTASHSRRPESLKRNFFLCEAGTSVIYHWVQHPVSKGLIMFLILVSPGLVSQS
jgi:hypothetical protein